MYADEIRNLAPGEFYPNRDEPVYVECHRIAGGGHAFTVWAFSMPEAFNIGPDEAVTVWEKQSAIASSLIGEG